MLKWTIDTDCKWMSHLYITGHSLGGYLAQWVQSEIIDGNLPWTDSFAVTFNAPGFNTEKLFPNFSEYQEKVTKKIKNNDDEHKYDNFIVNHRIIQDVISLFGTKLGTVHHYTAKLNGLDGEYYHSPSRFKELDLR